MKKVVSFSFGRSSAYLVIKAIKEFGVNNVDVVSMDTGAEHPKTYEFAKEFSKYIRNVYGKKVVHLRMKLNPKLGKGNGYRIIGEYELKHDLKPFKAMMTKYGTPYIGGMFCTDRMKLNTFTKYCQDTYGKKNYETWLGIRVDEQKRLTPKPFIKYLADISDFEKEDVLDFWSEMPFDLGINEWLGNCVFCPKKSNLKLAAAQRDEPELYADWLDMFYSDSVRVDDKTGHYSKMYRGNQSLESLIATFDGSTGAEIKARIRGGHHIDTNSCSESCEVFQ